MLHEHHVGVLFERFRSQELHREPRGATERPQHPRQLHAGERALLIEVDSLDAVLALRTALASVAALVRSIAAEGSTIADPAMRECVQETMYGAKFPPPQGGGEVQVTYPFLFKADGHP